MSTMNRCRVCLDQDLLTSIFNKRGLMMISLKLMSVAKIDISHNDGLPNKICTKCIERLDNCIGFIQLCENTDFELRRSLLNNENVKTYSEINLEIDNYLGTDDCKYSPKSDNDLFIDESVTDSITFEENIITNNSENNAVCLDDKVTIGSDLNDSLKGNKKQAQKQQCFTCGKVMSSRFRLKTHLRTHTGERPFSCPHCNKNFSLAQNLKVHLRIHTGEKPLQCSTCGESFAHSAGLSAHRRKHTGQTPYRCLLCPRSFRTVGHLQYHTRRHTGEKNFECDTCGRAFITRSDLKQHLRTHSGERPHICCVCGLRLTRASHLKRHIQHTHNNIKSMSCTQCSSKFAKQLDLDKHMKKHVEQTDGLEKYNPQELT